MIEPELETVPEISEESELETENQRYGKMVMLDPQFGIPIEINYDPEERERNSYKKPFNRNDDSSASGEVLSPPPAPVKKTKNSSRYRTQNEILTFALFPDEDEDEDVKLYRNQTWKPYSPEYLGEELQPKCRFQGLINQTYA